MDLIIRGTGNPDSASALNALALALDEDLRSRLSSFQFQSALGTVVIYLRVIPSGLGQLLDNVSHSRTQRAVTSYKSVEFDQFISGARADRIDLLVMGVAAALKQVPDRLLPQADRELLLKAVEETRLAAGGRAADHPPNIEAVTALASDAVTAPEADEIDEIQLIMQWDVGREDDPAMQAGFSFDISALEDILEEFQEDAFEVDGHDIGSGTVNIFLIARDVERAVSIVLKLYSDDRLAPGLRVGLAEGDECRPIYPPELTRFSII